jgi:hypothetical protein
LSFFKASTGTSVKFTTQGVELLLQIAGPTTEAQDTKFGTTEPKFWADGTPAMKALVPVVNESGENQTLHVPKGSRLHKAIGAALGAAGAPDLEEGGLLGLTWTGFTAGKNPGNPPRTYEGRYMSAADVAASAE